MSFATEVKRELCAQEAPACCQKAEAYGMFLFGRSFSLSGVSFLTENAGVARHAAALLAGQAGVFTQIETPLARKGKRGLVTVTAGPEDAAAVLGYFGHTGHEPSLRINMANLESDCCQAAFLRGAFLSCGGVTDPNKDYHLEFSVAHYHLSRALYSLLTQPGSVCPGVGCTARKGGYVLYLKNSEEIMDLLTFLGAGGAAMECMQVKMFKEVRNDVNRRTNFDTANLDKTAAAAAAQIAAIRRLEEADRLPLLPEDLQTVARLRLHNPEMTLRELAEILQLSRSGVSHRLRRLVELAGEAGPKEE